MANAVVVSDTRIDLDALRVALEDYEREHYNLFSRHGDMFANPNRFDLPINELDRLKVIGEKLHREIGRHASIYEDLLVAHRAGTHDLYLHHLEAYCRLRDEMKRTFEVTLLAINAAHSGYAAYAYRVVDGDKFEQGRELTATQVLEHRCLTSYYVALSDLKDRFKEQPVFLYDSPTVSVMRYIFGLVLVLLFGWLFSQGPNYLGYH